jgi:hypothetical protein
MNKQESNKLLAEFMGFEWYEINKPYIAVREPNGGIRHFSTDWNDLMQVVEKIENYNEFTSVLFAPQGCAIDVCIDNGFAFSNDCNTKIEAVYNACVEFVQWYNNQNK